MICRIKVKCPPGQAESVEKKFRVIALPVMRKATIPTRYIAPDGASFYWELDLSVKGYMTVQRKLLAFNLLATGTLDAVQKRTMLKRLAKISDQTIYSVRNMINETEVEIIKNATAEEIVAANTTYWEHIKNTFKRVSN